MARVPNRYIWHKGTPPPGRPDGVWSVSYADLMTLLLCFFVVILMVSPPPVPRADKVQSVMASLRSAFSMTRDAGRASPARQGTLLEQLVAMTENAADNGAAPGRSAVVSVNHESDGIHIRLRSGARPAHALSDAPVLETQAERALRRMAPALRDLNPYIEVRAYVGAAGRSGNATAEAADRRSSVAMEGAFQRARAVADVLTQCELPIDRLQIVTATGAGSAGAGAAAGVRDAGGIDVVVQARRDPVQTFVSHPPSPRAE